MFLLIVVPFENDDTIITKRYDSSNPTIQNLSCPDFKQQLGIIASCFSHEIHNFSGQRLQ